MELINFERQDLPAQLRSDRAARTGDHHTPAGDELLERTPVEADRRACQEVFNREAADLRNRHAAVDYLD